jgi:16S rRNA (cytosine967-C5)-methyltransferase
MALFKIVSGEKPREIAVQVLGLRGERDFTEELLDRELAGANLLPADRRLCQELVYGIVRWQASLDWLIARKTANRVQKPVLQNLLRLGLYQIFWLDRIPNHAAVHVTVELAKHRGFGPQAGFVNAILRGYLREFDATHKLLSELQRDRPALGYSHPQWLVDRWQARWGKDRAIELLAWDNTPPRTFARVNTLKIDAAKLLLLWREENVEYDFIARDWFEENLVFELKSHPSLDLLPSFQKGYFYVQDPSTLLAVNELDPKPGETILDLCAAPGGKLIHIAQRMGNQGRIVGYDTAPERLKLLADNCARLGVTCVELTTARHPPLATRHFDKILVDAPCSNTGVMRRRVDLRWRVNLKEIDRLRKTQAGLLGRAVRMLKPGGALVYSTCSIEPEENRKVIDSVLSSNSGLSVEAERELLPFTHNVDGAYVVSILRK